jgi:hypothetical protein
MQFGHAFCNPVKHINVELIIGKCSKHKIINATIRPFETMRLTYQIYKGEEGKYLLLAVVVAMSQRSFPHAQPL